jgi:hypothetical protein
LPPAQYRYLHPPPALARTNKRPASITKTITLKHGLNSTDFVLFTGDAQAGIGAHPGDLAASRPATQLVLTIRPVNQPASLPDHLALDGNAYQFDMTGKPGGRPATLRHKIGLVLVWPRFPVAVYVYRAHRWQLACDSRTWQTQNNIVICHTSVLGVFALVHHAPTRGRMT